MLKRVDQAYSTMEIHDSSVKTDADALLYATNHGIAAGSIKSIGLNADKSHYVVTYNTSKTGINNTTPAREPKTPTVKPTVTTPTQEQPKAIGKRTYTFYSIKTEDEARKELVRLGNDEKAITSIKKVNDAIVAEVTVYEKKRA